MSEKYNFDQPTDRRNTNSLKWDVAEHELPMWVADMDFKTAPAIREAMARRLENGVFGYTIVPKAWNEAYANWWDRRHGFKLDKDALIFATGVVPILSSLVRKLTTPNENVVILTPVYNIFFNSIINNGARVLESDLVYENGAYRIDFEDLEKKLSNPQTSLMILCNPHNPVGKIWDKDTLARIGDLAKENGVVVISDEIHCDLTDPGADYIPFASVSKTCEEISVSCFAPTKAFNLAGMQTAAAYVPDKFLRHKVYRALNTDEVAEPNAFAVDVAIAAFNEAQDWLDQLRQYIFENKQIVKDFLEKNLPMLKLVESDATYLLWVDCSSLGMDSESLCNHIRQKTGLYLTPGIEYGRSGDDFIRINIACQRDKIIDGLERLKSSVLDCI